MLITNLLTLFSEHIKPASLIGGNGLDLEWKSSVLDGISDKANKMGPTQKIDNNHLEGTDNPQFEESEVS